MADLVVAESKIHGLGVFASRAFNEGEIVLILDDSRTVDDEHPLRAELGEYPHHCDYLASGKVVLMQWPERHINSSCDPNNFVKTSVRVRHIVMRRPVNCSEEVTLDCDIDCHNENVLSVQLRKHAVPRHHCLQLLPPQPHRCYSWGICLC